MPLQPPCPEQGSPIKSKLSRTGILLSAGFIEAAALRQYRLADVDPKPVLSDCNGLLESGFRSNCFSIADGGALQAPAYQSNSGVAKPSSVSAGKYLRAPRQIRQPRCDIRTTVDSWNPMIAQILLRNTVTGGWVHVAAALMDCSPEAQRCVPAG
jgi:hypothetical protein